MPELQVTCITAAILAVLMVLLSLPISLRRQRTGISLGVGEDAALHNLVRAHGNFVEYAPLALILVVLLEYNGAPTGMLWTAAGAIILGRLIHAAGMMMSSVPLRALGMILTYVSLITGAIGAIMYCRPALV